ncbi:MAG: hypothetical protein AB7G25_07635 [Sphingomonadaceae bacterium]
MDKPCITITRDRVEYVVKVVPEPDIRGVAGSFVTKREAFGYASGLRMVHGWPVVDMTGAR